MQQYQLETAWIPWPTRGPR
uniref:Uncharacterized protein n=1 Tax=Arundo donax TaxID=35708 RepID=A0A0A8YSK2_ARUDO